MIKSSDTIKTLAVGLSVSIVLLVLIEIISSVWLKAIYNRDFDTKLIEQKKFGDSDGLKNKASGMVWGKSFHTDEFGGRKNIAAYSVNKKNTILYIGDSVTEGVGVEDSSTFASIISSEYVAQNVINYSLIGYSVVDYLNVIKSVTESDSSISAIRLMFTLNDVYGRSKTNDLPVMAKTNWIGRANAFLQERYSTYKLIKLYVYRNSDAYFRYDASFYNEENPFFREAASLLSACDSVCRKKNIEFSVVGLPYRSQLSSHNTTPQKTLQAFCRKQNISFQDATDFLSGQSNSSYLYLFADEIHFSEKGHRAIAEFLLHN